MQTRKLIFRLLLIIAITALLVSVLCVSASAMQIFVKTPSGTHATLEVDLTDRVEDVRSKIEDKLGFSEEEYRLLYNGTELLDGNTLQDYSIHKDNLLSIELHQYDSCTDSVCNVCGYNRTNATHSYDNDLDTDCNNAGCTQTRVIVIIQVIDDTLNSIGSSVNLAVELTTDVVALRDKIVDMTSVTDCDYLLFKVPSSGYDNISNYELLEEGNTLLDHGVEQWTVIAAMQHYTHTFINCECQICHYKRPHKYTDCTDRLCDNEDCIYIRDDAQTSHAFDSCLDADCNNTDCSFTREPATEHIFSDCTDSTCNNFDSTCSATREANSAHSFDSCLDSDCNTEGCGFSREPNKKHAFDDCLDSECNNEGCSFTREPAVEHIFTDCTDKTCDNEDCPFEREANAKHIFTDCTDADCNTEGCPFVREANANHIFDGCLDTDCNSKDCPFTREAKPHEGGAATCVRPAVCEACGNEYGDIMPHTPSEEWVITDTHHYHRCEYWSETSSCKEKYNNEEHKYGDWVVTKEADVLITGEMERECFCGHKDYESIPAKPMFEEPIGTTEWIVLAAAAAVVLIVSGVCWYLNKP